MAAGSRLGLFVERPPCQVHGEALARSSLRFFAIFSALGGLAASVRLARICEIRNKHVGSEIGAELKRRRYCLRSVFCRLFCRPNYAFDPFLVWMNQE